MSISVSDETLLQVNNLSAYYGEARVLHNVSFALRKGQVLAIIGANGAGKTTLLRSIMGMMSKGHIAHIEGSVTFRGQQISNLITEEIVNTGVTMVPEGRRLFSRLSVQDNVLCGAYLPRCRAAAPALLEEIYDLFPRLRERREQIVSQMSGGEQQMVAVARALMSTPELVLFDELSLGLAPVIVDDIYQKVKLINQKGTSCIIIEQDMQRAMSVADYIVVMLEGKVVLADVPAKLSKEVILAAYFGNG